MSEDFDPTIPDSQQDDPILPEFPEPQEPEDPQAAQVDSPDQFQPADAPDDSEPRLADLKNQFEEYKLGQQVLFGQLQDQVSELLGERLLMQKQLSDLATKGAQNPPPDPFINPFGQTVIVAQEGATALQWQQRYVRQGVLVDFTGGLLCDNDTLPSALIEMADDEFALIPMVDPNGGSQCMRFIKIAGGSSESCNIDTINQLADSTEGSEAADTLAWDVDDGEALDLWAFTRVAYYDAGDEKLYGYARKLSFNTCGKLYAVSAETRVTIDVPEEC